MKKIKFITIWLLCFVFLGSIFCTVINEVLAQINGNTFTWGTPYVLNKFSVLDEKTRRNSIARDADGNIKSPQITVFTYGCGGALSHWSNNQAENPSDDYDFRYEKD